jgi:hypothetical protein
MPMEHNRRNGFTHLVVHPESPFGLDPPRGWRLIGRAHQHRLSIYQDVSLLGVWRMWRGRFKPDYDLDFQMPVAALSQPEGMRKALEELRALSEKATAGEWAVKSQRLEGADPEAVGDRNNSIWVDGGQGPIPVVAVSKVRSVDAESPWPAMCHIAPEDAAFIVAAVNFVRAALAANPEKRGG